jgi:twinkle protein
MINPLDSIQAASYFSPEVVAKFFPEPGVVSGSPTHWAKLPFRFYPSELSVWTGINGHGKSLFLGQLALDFALLGEKSFIASFEMPAPKTVYRLVRQALGKENPEEFDVLGCLGWLGQRFYIYDKLGTGDIKELCLAFTAAQENYGVKHVFIDSLMKCNISPEDYKAQANFVDSLQNYAQKSGLHVHLVAHAKKLQSEEDKPGKMDVKGAMEITNHADNVFSIWRDKKKERLSQEYFDTHQLPGGMTLDQLRQKPDCVVDCSKHREMGSDGEGMFGLYYHRASFQYLEKLNQDPMIYYEGTFQG